MSEEIDAMERAQEFAVTLMDAVEQYSPAAVEVALAVGWASAAQYLLSGFALLALSLVFLFVFKIAARKLKKRRGVHKGAGLDDYQFDPFPEMGVMMGCACFSFVAAIAGASHLVTIAAWIGLSEPAVYLAWKAIQ